MKLLALLGNAKWLAAFAGVVMLSVLSFNPLGGGEYHITAPFTNTAGLYAGSDVLIAGAQVGTVDSINFKGNLAMVTFSVGSSHAPVFANASVDLRPKSLLGEMYIDLNPGTGGRTLPSGSVLAPSQVQRAVDLSDVINTFNAPTRAKLQTLILELGGGLAGEGTLTNQTFTYGTADMNDLAAISQTLQSRDQQLQEVIQALNAVMGVLSTSERRADLGQLIVNTDNMLRVLEQEDGRLQAALVETDAALSKTNGGLNGTAQNLADIIHTLPTLVNNTQLLTADLGGSEGLDDLLAPCAAGSYCQAYEQQAGGNSLYTQLLSGIDEGPVVFGGYDAQGYATRIAIIVDHCSASGTSKCTSNTSPLPGVTCKNFPKSMQNLCNKIGQLPLATTSGQLYMPDPGADAVVTGAPGASPSDATLGQLLLGGPS